MISYVDLFDHYCPDGAIIIILFVTGTFLFGIHSYFICCPPRAHATMKHKINASACVSQTIVCRFVSCLLVCELMPVLHEAL